MSIHQNVNGSIKTYSNVFENVGGSIKTLDAVHQNVNGSLKLLHQGLPSGLSWYLHRHFDNSYNTDMKVKSTANNGLTVTIENVWDSNDIMWFSIRSNPIYLPAGTIITIKDNSRASEAYIDDSSGVTGYRKVYGKYCLYLSSNTGGDTDTIITHEDPKYAIVSGNENGSLDDWDGKCIYWETQDDYEGTNNTANYRNTYYVGYGEPVVMPPIKTAGNYKIDIFIYMEANNDGSPYLDQYDPASTLTCNVSFSI